MQTYIQPSNSKQLRRFQIQGTENINRAMVGKVGNWLRLATAVAFSSGAMLLGYFLGGHLVLIAGLNATTDICIPSIIYQLTVGHKNLVKGIF